MQMCARAEHNDFTLLSHVVHKKVQTQWLTKMSASANIFANKTFEEISFYLSVYLQKKKKNFLFFICVFCFILFLVYFYLRIFFLCESSTNKRTRETTKLNPYVKKYELIHRHSIRNVLLILHYSYLVVFSFLLWMIQLKIYQNIQLTFGLNSERFLLF